MPRRFARPVAGALAGLALALSVATPARAATPPPSDTDYSENRILTLLNSDRRAHGLPPVSRNAGADVIAQYSANIQAWYGRLAHNPNLANDVTERVGPGWSWAGENVGCGADADGLHVMWLQSPGHKANMMRAQDIVGIGSVYARGCLWATVVYVDT